MRLTALVKVIALGESTPDSTNNQTASETLAQESSSGRSFNGNLVSQQQQQQAKSNRIIPGLLPGEPNSYFQQIIRAHSGIFAPEFLRRRGFMVSPRTVESPALSVDSGGRTSSSIASEVAKILNVKQGYYSDIYDKMDKPYATTKRPADALEDTIRNAVERYLAKRFYQPPQEINYNAIDKRFLKKDNNVAYQ